MHEQIAAVDLCGGVVAAEPALARDVIWGAACYLEVEARARGPCCAVARRRTSHQPDRPPTPAWSAEPAGSTDRWHDQLP